jgi:uncharacterized membrane protein YqiK
MTNAVATYEKPTFPAVTEFENRVALITVVDQDTYDLATEEIRYFRGIADTWEAERVRRKQPIDQIVKQLQDDFMPVINGAKQAESSIKAMQKAYMIAEERKRAEAQAEANRIAAAAQAEAAAKAAKLEAAGKVEQAQAVRAVAEVTTAVTIAPTAVKSSGTALPKRWKGRVTNVSEFLAGIASNPDRHHLVDILQAKIDRAIHETKGKMHLPGVENYEDFDIRVKR